MHKLGAFPGGTSGKEPACQRRRPKRCEFDSWVEKISWRKKWQPTPVFLSGEGRKIKSIKLEMKMERSQQKTQKYKGS